MTSSDKATSKNQHTLYSTHASGMRVTTINRQNMVVRGSKITVKRGRYSGATVQISDPVVIDQILEIGKVAIPLLVSYGLTRSASNASRGSRKKCRNKSVFSGKICKKPLYYRETEKDASGQSYEIFRCDLGHEFRQRIS